MLPSLARFREEASRAGSESPRRFSLRSRLRPHAARLVGAPAQGGDRYPRPRPRRSTSYAIGNSIWACARPPSSRPHGCLSSGACACIRIRCQQPSVALRPSALCDGPPGRAQRLAHRDKALRFGIAQLVVSNGLRRCTLDRRSAMVDEQSFALTLVYRMSFSTEELVDRTIEELKAITPGIANARLDRHRAMLSRAFPASQIRRSHYSTPHTRRCGALLPQRQAGWRQPRCDTRRTVLCHLVVAQDTRTETARSAVAASRLARGETSTERTRERKRPATIALCDVGCLWRAGGCTGDYAPADLRLHSGLLHPDLGPAARFGRLHHHRIARLRRRHRSVDRPLERPDEQPLRPAKALAACRYAACHCGRRCPLCSATSAVACTLCAWDSLR